MREELGQQKGIGPALETRQSHTIKYGVNQIPERYLSDICSQNMSKMNILWKKGNSKLASDQQEVLFSLLEVCL